MPDYLTDLSTWLTALAGLIAGAGGLGGIQKLFPGRPTTAKLSDKLKSCFDDARALRIVNDVDVRTLTGWELLVRILKHETKGKD